MKLNTLFQTNSLLSIEIIMLTLYPDEEDNIDGYKKVFERLFNLTPITTSFTLEIKHQIDRYNEEFIEITGIKKDEDTPFALDFAPWAEWLDMDISSSTFEEFTN